MIATKDPTNGVHQVSQEQWNAVCSKEFTDVKDVQKEQGKDISLIREKLFDGISTAAAMIPEVQLSVARIETKLDAHINSPAPQPQSVSTKKLIQNRSFDAAVVGVIVAIITNGGKIMSFFENLFSTIGGLF